MSTLSATLKRRAGVLAAGAALCAATLAILPGVAEAQALGTRALGGGQGGNAGPTVTIQATLNGNNSANTFQREASSYVAHNTTQNFGGAAQGVSAGSNLTSQVSGSIGVGTASQQATGAVQGVSTDLADRAGGAVTVNSSTLATESIAVAQRPLVEGAVDSTTEAVAPVVPAQATATVNGNVAVGEAVTQDVCLNAALNQAAGSCGGSANGTGTTLGTNAGSIELTAPEVAADSGTTVTEDAAVAQRPVLNGGVNKNTEVAAPSVPAEGAATLDANVAAGNLVNQDVCLNAGLNAAAGGCGTAAPATDNPATSVDASGAAGVNEPLVPAQSGTGAAAGVTADPIAAADACLGAGINQEAGGCDAAATPQDDRAPSSSAVHGDVNSRTGIDASTVPAGGETTVDSSAVAAGLVDVNACLNAGVNQEPGSCGQRAGANDSADGADPAATNLAVNGDANSSVRADAPAVPASGGATVASSAVVDDLAGLGACLGVGLNQNPSACGDPATGANPPDGDSPGDGGGVDPTVDGDVAGSVRVEAPLPAAGRATLDSEAAVGNLAVASVCLNAGVNQDPRTCEGVASSGDATSPGGGERPSSGDGSPTVTGDVNSGIGLDAPAVPAEGAATVNGDSVIEELVAVGICLGAGLNQEPGTCGGGAAPSEQPGGGGTLVDGDIDATTGVVAPAVPAEGGATLEAGAVAEGLASLDACVNAGVNQGPGSCDEQASPDNSGDGTTAAGGGNTAGDGGNALYSSSSGTPNGNEPPGGGGETAGDFDGLDSSNFVASPSAEASSAAELRLAESSTGGDNPMLDATLEDADLRLSLSEPGSSLAAGTSSDGPGVSAAFTSGETLDDAEDAQQPGVGPLPDTSGGELWKAALGVLLLLMGVFAVRRSWAEVIARN